MKILVCGGREYDDWQSFCGHLWAVFKNLGLDNQDYFEGDNSQKIIIIHGDAKGADFMARIFCKIWGCAEKRFPADWKKYGKGAGSIRNQQMLDEGEPDIVIAFPGGVGTADMVSRAKKCGIEVKEIKE